MQGFVTVATGGKYYYKLALNLLISYKKTNHDIPFCIITDKQNPYIAQFEKAIIMDSPTNSYLDKLKVYEYLPYQKNIIIDADSLVFDNISFYFDKFQNATSVSSKGIITDKDSDDGWFTACNMGQYKDRLLYSIRLHGGIYYVEKSTVAQRVYACAQEIQQNYDTLKFNYFTKPSDESIMALAMALCDCKPEMFDSYEFTYYPQYEKQIVFEPYKRRILLNNQDVKVMHWSTGKTLRYYIYKKYVAYFNVDAKYLGKKKLFIEFKFFAYKYLHKIYSTVKRILK